MSSWKDTVMDKILIDASDGLASKKKIKEIRGLLEQQAERTWDKAIREVVEWVKTNDDSGVTCTIKLNPEEWQAKLKEWGIDEADKNKAHKC